MLSGFIRFIEDRFERLIQLFSDFLDPFLDAISKNGGELLLNVALDAVKAVAADPTILTDDDKRKTAFDHIVETLKDQGIQVATSAANSAIEIALQKFKAEQAGS